jgi:exosortase K
MRLSFKNLGFTVVLWAAVAAILAALKIRFPDLSPTELLWILGPTTLAVELLTGTSFLFDPGVGFVGVQSCIIINAGCAGINFLLVVAALSLAVLPRKGSPARRALLTAGLLFASFAAAIFINALRISVSLTIAGAGIGGLAAFFGGEEKFHLLLGIFMFSFFLFLYSLLVMKAKERMGKWVLK